MRRYKAAWTHGNTPTDETRTHQTQQRPGARTMIRASRTTKKRTKQHVDHPEGSGPGTQHVGIWQWSHNPRHPCQILRHQVRNWWHSQRMMVQTPKRACALALERSVASRIGCRFTLSYRPREYLSHAEMMYEHAIPSNESGTF